MTSYRPFIDDPRDLARFQGDRYVVLRASGAVADAWSGVAARLKDHLANSAVRYVAQPHVTLGALPKGTPLAALKGAVAAWAASISPLRLDVAQVGSFPAPFQIVMLRMRTTPELVAARSSLRAALRERGLEEQDTVPDAGWIAHMSVAYCSELSAAEWTSAAQFAERLPVTGATGVVREAEIVAFDEGREYGGGAFELSAR